MDNTALIATFSLIAFVFFLLSFRSEKLPVPELLRFMESNGREATMLIALGLFLGFLLRLN